MAIRYRGGQIQSYMPSVDARVDDSPRVLNGRNFEFDVLGPKAGFGNAILTPFPFGMPQGIQGLRIRGRTFVITQDAILAWRTIVPFTWEVLYAFPIYMPDPLALPWFAFSVDNDIYIGHPNRGIYFSPIEENTQKLDLQLLTELHVPGLPAQVYGSAIVRNRVILVTKNVIYWSDIGDFSSLEPTLGGAGFQLIQDFIGGDFLGIAPFNDGFIVWTTQGGILAEYIGGDAVWRWQPFTSQERPIGPWATVQLSNGATLFLSQRGLKLTVNGQIPQDFTPDFNEYFRDYTRKQMVNLDMWRLTYDMASERVYLAESLTRVDYWRTYAFQLTLDKWGIFSDTHYGLLPFTNRRFGFVDLTGLPRYFNDSIYRDQHPANEKGFNRIYPRVQKGGFPPSSSAVSRVKAYQETLPVPPGVDPAFLPDEIIQAGWADDYSFMIKPYDKGGLDSWIEIGYFRPAEMNNAADGNIEIHEVVIGTPRSAPTSETPEYALIGREEYWDWEEEDWNSEPFIVGFDFVVDLNTLDGVHDLNNFIGSPVDLNAIQFWLVDWPAGVIEEDWNLPGEPEDWNGGNMNLPELQTKVTIQYSMDGMDHYLALPEVARFDSTSKIFSTQTHGNLHRLRLEANAPLEYYHVTYLEFTMQYGGEWV